MFYILCGLFMFSIPALYIWPEKQIGGVLLLFGALAGLRSLYLDDRRASTLFVGLLFSVVLSLINQLQFMDSMIVTITTFAMISGAFLFYDWIKETLEPSKE